MYIGYTIRYVYIMYYFVFGARPFRIKDYDLGLAFGL